MKTLTAVLLVGGLSRRMGSDKATMALRGETGWARQLKLLRAIQPEVLWISARTRPAWCPPEIEIVPDEPPSRGPLSGLAAALQRLTTSHLFALAIDLPHLTPEMLTRIWQNARPGCGVVPVNAGIYEPLCAVYPKESAPVAKSALAAGQLSLQDFVRTLVDGHLVRTQPVSTTERPLFHNVNTPADIT